MADSFRLYLTDLAKFDRQKCKNLAIFHDKVGLRGSRVPSGPPDWTGFMVILPRKRKVLANWLPDLPFISC